MDYKTHFLVDPFRRRHQKSPRDNLLAALEQWVGRQIRESESRSLLFRSRE